MTKTWVGIIVGVCVVITLAIAARHFRTGGGDEPGRARVPIAVPAGGALAERAGGWSTRQNTGEAGQTSGAVAARGGAQGERGSGPGAAESGGGAATVITGGRRAGDALGASGSTASEEGAIQIARPREPGVRFERPGGLGGDRPGESVVRGQPLPQDAAEEGKEEDPNGPVLSLSLQGTTEPDKGDAPVVAEGVSFESEDGAKFSTDAQFAVPNAGGITGEAGTFAFTIQGEWPGNDNTDASFVQLRTPNEWNNRIQVTKNGQWMRFLFTDDTGMESGVGVPINWQPGETHNIATTWGEDPETGQRLTRLYIDGRLVGQSPYNGNFVPPSGPLYIGSDHPGGQPGARGTISRFTAYNRLLGPDEVRGLQ
ncbi:MAG: LamG domain-containing protein [Deltaproteobacteria bacterium]|nr:LamG domain-containing protein [Deltaproteobacteria bacterium]